MMTDNRLICPICFDEIWHSQKIVICPVDKSIHHASCWNYNNHQCATFMCDGEGVQRAKTFNSKNTLKRKQSDLSSRRSFKNKVTFGPKGISLFSVTIVFLALLTLHISDILNIGVQQEKLPDEVLFSKEFVGDIVEQKITNRDNSKIRQSTATISSVPLEYSCPDPDDIELYSGAVAFVGKVSVSMRSEPIVPENSRENIVANLMPGYLLEVKAGPICSHQGSWWLVQLNNQIEDWVREICVVFGRIIHLYTN